MDTPSSTGIYCERNGYCQARIVVGGIDGWPYFLGRFAEEGNAVRAVDMAIRLYRPSDPTSKGRRD